MKSTPLYIKKLKLRRLQQATAPAPAEPEKPKKPQYEMHPYNYKTSGTDILRTGRGILFKPDFWTDPIEGTIVNEKRAYMDRGMGLSVFLVSDNRNRAYEISTAAILGVFLEVPREKA